MTSNVKTMAPFFFCSPSYGAPEQFDPTLGELGPWTDVYALRHGAGRGALRRQGAPGDQRGRGARRGDGPAQQADPARDGNGPGAGDGAHLRARAFALHPKQRWAGRLALLGTSSSRRRRRAAADDHAAPGGLGARPAQSPARRACRRARRRSISGRTCRSLPRPRSPARPRSYKFPANELLGVGRRDPRGRRDAHQVAAAAVRPARPPSEPHAGGISAAAHRGRGGRGILFALAVTAGVVGLAHAPAEPRG